MKVASEAQISLAHEALMAYLNDHFGRDAAVSWTAVRFCGVRAGTEHDYLIERAKEDGLTPSQVLRMFATAIANLQLDEGDDEPPWDHEATPPGSFDLRVFDQSDVWTDIYGVRHVIRDQADLTEAYLINLVEYLRKLAAVFEADLWAINNDVDRPGVRRAAAMLPAGHRTDRDPGHRGLAWLESTPLFRELVAEAGRRGIDLPY